MPVLWFWVLAIVAVAIYTFVSLVLDARIARAPDTTYRERCRAALRGWSTSVGFFALGDFIGVSATYEIHGHLVDWVLTPLLVTWPLVLIDLLLLGIASVLLALLTAFIPPRVRVPWLVLGIALFAAGIVHGAMATVQPPAY
jgi:hypothetical protein